MLHLLINCHFPGSISFSVPCNLLIPECCVWKSGTESIDANSLCSWSSPRSLTFSNSFSAQIRIFSFTFSCYSHFCSFTFYSYRFLAHLDCRSTARQPVDGILAFSCSKNVSNKSLTDYIKMYN